MEKYDYLEAVKEDVREYIKNEIDLLKFEDKDELSEYLNDHLFIEDSVTGNASGSYTFNAWQAEENLCHNWDLLKEALEELDSPANILDKGPEMCDVIIRYYLLPQAISEVLCQEWNLIISEQGIYVYLRQGFLDGQRVVNWKQYIIDLILDLFSLKVLVFLKVLQFTNV